jgi:membrane-associated phospholipid phosphatase
MVPISSTTQPRGKTRRSRLGAVRGFTIAAVLMLSAARCGKDDITSPPPLEDPITATISTGETLSSVRWNGIAQTLVGKNRPSQNAALRIMAYLTLTEHASVEIVAHVRGVTRPRMRGAVAGASAPVLIYAFPADSALIESYVREEEATLPEWQRGAFRSAEVIGRTVAQYVLARARSDGFNVPWTGTVPVGPGKWRSLNVPPTSPLLPLGGEVLPFFMSKGSQFRPPPPPEFDSPAFRDALGEVRRIFDTRTPLQDSLAKFWALPTGGLIAGYWNTAAIELITKGRLGERAATRVLAVMNTASNDALIACHDAKYTYWLIRPSGADTAIKTSVGVPNHPSYPSNHACFSGAAATVLGSYFPVAREQLQAKAHEASLSRLYGGLHYRFDADVGLEIARKVSRLALEAAHRGRMTAMAQP